MQRSGGKHEAHAQLHRSTTVRSIHPVLDALAAKTTRKMSDAPCGRVTYLTGERRQNTRPVRLCSICVLKSSTAPYSSGKLLVVTRNALSLLGFASTLTTGTAVMNSERAKLY